MTTGMLGSILLRRWFIVAFVLIITAAAMVHVYRKAGVYWAQVDVVFLIPKSARYPNTILDTSASAISMAGLVAEDVNRGVDLPATASSGTTLVGEGVRDGWAVRLPNSGGQWAWDFERPVLDVEVVGADPKPVKAKLLRLIATIEADLHQRQADEGARQSDFITASSAPSKAVVYEFHGHRSRALGATLLLGLLGALLSAVGFDRLMERRSLARGRSATSGRAPRRELVRAR